MALAVTGISFPAFALGMLLMQVFSVELGWLPTVGADSWRHYILPSLTLGAAVAAVMARFTRASFVDVLHEDYMRTARAKGVSETGGAQARSAQCDDPGGDHDGAAVRLFARRVDRGGEGL
jgi:glutathione transport system permease protein